MNSRSTYELIKKTIEIVNAFEPKTKYDRKRKAIAIRLLQMNIERAKKNEPIDCGLYGKVRELLSHNSLSPIVRVRPQGKSDSFIRVNGKRRPLEVKTNGGRIESLFTMSERAKETSYIRYILDKEIKAGKPRKDGSYKPKEYRCFDGVMTVKTFIEILESTKAYKVIGHNESDRERAVQSDSKKLYIALHKALYEGKAVWYETDFDYVASDFE